MENILYHQLSVSPLLRCLDSQEADYVLREIYEGACGSHVGGKPWRGRPC